MFEADTVCNRPSCKNRHCEIPSYNLPKLCPPSLLLPPHSPIISTTIPNPQQPNPPPPPPPPAHPSTTLTPLLGSSKASLPRLLFEYQIYEKRRCMIYIFMLGLLRGDGCYAFFLWEEGLERFGGEVWCMPVHDYMLRERVARSLFFWEDFGGEGLGVGGYVV